MQCSRSLFNSQQPILYSGVKHKKTLSHVREEGRLALSAEPAGNRRKSAENFTDRGPVPG